MKNITGITVGIFDKDLVLIKVANDGYLGRLKSKKLTLQVTIGRDCWAHVFTVDGQKNVVPKTKVEVDGNDDRIYRLVISTQEGDQGRYTMYPTNNLRLADFATTSDNFNETGVVALWEIAVISQGGEFFLTIQKGYELECYQSDDGHKMYPRFERTWSQMDEYLVSLLPESVNPAHVSAYMPDEEPPLNGMTDKEGLVQWFNDAQGMGAIITKRGLARVHWSQIERRPRRSFLVAGEHVRFTELRTPRNTRGRESAFQLEAVSVSRSFN